MAEGKTKLSVLNKTTVVVLLLAIVPLPYSYYIFLRWAVLISTSIHLYFAITNRRKAAGIIFLVIGVLFNPFAPVYFAKGIWIVLDLFCAMFMTIGLEELNKEANTTVNTK